MSTLSIMQARAQAERKRIMEMSEKEFYAEYPVNNEVPTFSKNDPCWRCNGGGCESCESF